MPVSTANIRAFLRTSIMPPVSTCWRNWLSHSMSIRWSSFANIVNGYRAESDVFGSVLLQLVDGPSVAAAVSPTGSVSRLSPSGEKACR